MRLFYVHLEAEALYVLMIFFFQISPSIALNLVITSNRSSSSCLSVFQLHPFLLCISIMVSSCLSLGSTTFSNVVGSFLGFMDKIYL